MFDEGDVAFQNEKTKFGSGKDGYFQGKNNKKCEIHYVSGVMAASFPWWILLVIFLIVLIVLLAVWYYKKQKKQQEDDDEEGDIDAKQDLEKNAPVPAKDDPSLWAGNVPGETPGSYSQSGVDHIPDHIPDGEIEAKQDHSSEVNK